MNWKARNAGVVAVLVIGVIAGAEAGPVTAGEAAQVAAETATTESPTAGLRRRGGLGMAKVEEVVGKREKEDIKVTNKMMKIWGGLQFFN